MTAISSSIGARVLPNQTNLYACIVHIRTFQAYYTPCNICTYGVYTRLYAYAYNIRYTPETTLTIQQLQSCCIMYRTFTDISIDSIAYDYAVVLYNMLRYCRVWRLLDVITVCL
jgi:hypothetical protein